MSINSGSPLLLSSIKDLPFTNAFKVMAEKQKLNTLGEIISVEVGEFLKLPGFTYHFLQELIQFLEERNLANLLRQ